MLEGAKIALCISQNKLDNAVVLEVENFQVQTDDGLGILLCWMLDNAVVLEVENFQVQQYKEGGGNPWCG